MRIKVLRSDFVVRERARLALTLRGPWAVYRVRKVGLTTLQVQTRLAALLKLPRERLGFPALKDKEAISYQFATLPSGYPETIEDKGFSAQRVGFRLRPLSTSDLRGNSFSIVMRDLSADDANHLAHRLATISATGIPNYFDQQRFGSFAPGWGWIGKAILQRDASSALYAYLTQPFLGDPRPTRAFKRLAVTLWPDWDALLEAAPRPSNFRSVLTFLKDHPQDYRKALNLVPQRLLSLYLAAYQSYLWNRVASAYVVQIASTDSGCVAHLNVCDQSLAIYIDPSADALARLAAVAVPLPHHRAAFQPIDVERLALDVLTDERFTLADLKARILRKAYLARGQRSLLLLPEDVRVDSPASDDRFPGRFALRTRFTLPRGGYATLVLKAAETSFIA